MIRLATGSDLPEVAVLEAGLFGADAWDLESLRSELDGPGRRFVVAQAGAVLGYAVSMSAGEVVDLQRIGVRSDQQGSGVATALMDDMVAHPGDADRMLLEVSAANRRAIAFYLRCGFSQIHVRPRYYRDGSDALVMQRALVDDGDGGWVRMES